MWRRLLGKTGVACRLANPRGERLLAASAAVHGCDEGRAILRASGNIARKVAMYWDAQLNMALALLCADDEAVLS